MKTDLFHQWTEVGVSTQLGRPALKIVGEEIRQEPDIATALLLLKEVPSVQGNLQRVGLVITRSVQVSLSSAVHHISSSTCPMLLLIKWTSGLLQS